MNYKEELDFICQKIESYQASGLKVFASSSFQSHSIPMLHILSSIDASIPVYFLNTGYHFPETIQFKDEVTKLLGIKVIDLKSNIPKSQQKDHQGRLLFTSDPDYCCYLNKTQPMEPILAEKDVWITGVRKDQSANRSNIDYEANATQGTIRFHPMLNFDKKMINQYMKDHQLPRHPLEQKGYASIGCEPCTQKVDPALLEDERYARWMGLNKTECGLHTELIDKNEE